MAAPTVETRSELPYVSIPAEANLREWGPVTHLVAEVMGWVHQRGLELTAPPFFRYWIVGDEESASGWASPWTRRWKETTG